MSDTDGPRLVQATQTSLQILEFVRDQDGARLTDVAEALDIGYSTAHNHLATLEDGEWLVREDGEYTLALCFLNYGRLARRRTPFFQIVRRYMDELSQQTNLEVEFLVEENGRIVSLIDITSNTPGYSNVDDDWQGVGIFYHMNNTASGKAMLAQMPEERVAAILERWGLPAQTPYSVTEREMLEEQLEMVRRQGYATAHQEVHEGFENAAVAVNYPDGRIFGAVSIGWPSYLFDDGLDQGLVDQLKETKRELEAELAEATAE
jgi:DNA-binding IclR family transcriptional regulator